MSNIRCDQSCHALNRAQHARGQDMPKNEDTLEHGECHRVIKYENMVQLPRGTFFMGTNEPVIVADGEGPERSITIESFWLDIHEVSNRQFRDFVRESGYKTEAETFGSSFVFQSMLDEKVLMNVTQSVKGAEWWVLVHGAFWRRPGREQSDRDQLDQDWLDHPVVHVSWHDARAFCLAQGKRLPREAEWEYACRANLSRRLFPWGNNVTPRGEHYMNIWQGHFPHNNTGTFAYFHIHTYCFYLFGLLWSSRRGRLPMDCTGRSISGQQIWSQEYGGKRMG